MTRPRPLARIAAWAVAGTVSLLFLYPYLWMALGSMRSTRAILSAPLRPWPEQWTLDAYIRLHEVAGVTLWRAVANSLGITLASTALAVGITAMGAYALCRRPGLLAFRFLRGGFLLTMMYPYMLLVIPVYIVMYRLHLLGGYTGIVLFLSLGPVQFFLFEQFFRALPAEVIEAATIDGAQEWDILWRVVMPMARPVVATVSIITFLLNWAQWFPVLVVSTTPDTYTLPVALLNLNGELGTDFQGIMALSVITTLPPAILFLIAQRRVIGGMTEGAVKG